MAILGCITVRDSACANAMSLPTLATPSWSQEIACLEIAMIFKSVNPALMVHTQAVLIPARKQGPLLSCFQAGRS